MKITIDNKLKNVGCGPPDFLYAPHHNCIAGAEVLLNMFQMMRPLNWAILEYAKVSFANNNSGKPYYDFQISLDAEKFLGNKLKVLARWTQNDSLFYGMQDGEENYDNLHRLVPLPKHLFLHEVVSAVSIGLTTAIQESVKLRIDNLTRNTDGFLSRINEQPDKK